MDFESILDQLADAVVVASPDSTVRYANRALGELVGRPREQVVGRPISELMPERLRLRHERGFARYRATSEPRMFGDPVAMTVLTADGDERPVDLTLGEVVLPGEDEAVVVATLHDASARDAVERVRRSRVTCARRSRRLWRCRRWTIPTSR